MPKIIIEMLPGRTLEQKRILTREITDVVSRVAAVDRNDVHIIIHENNKENVAQGGVLLADVKVNNEKQ